MAEKKWRRGILISRGSKRVSERENESERENKCDRERKKERKKERMKEREKERKKKILPTLKRVPAHFPQQRQDSDEGVERLDATKSDDAVDDSLGHALRERRKKKNKFEPNNNAAECGTNDK